MSASRGYALIESLLASIILISGLVSIASLFSLTTTVNVRNRQFTAATLLVYDKLEQLCTAGLAAGGSLNAANPAPGFMEFIHLQDDGILTIDSAAAPFSYLRLWQIDGAEPQTVTVVVFAGIGQSAPLELARASRFSIKP